MSGSPSVDTDELLTIGEAARTAHLSVDTLRRWAKEGKIPVTVLPSGHRRFRRSDIEALLKASA